jgi:hypothetical protein
MRSSASVAFGKLCGQRTGRLLEIIIGLGADFCNEMGEQLMLMRPLGGDCFAMRVAQSTGAVSSRRSGSGGSDCSFSLNRRSSASSSGGRLLTTAATSSSVYLLRTRRRAWAFPENEILPPGFSEGAQCSARGRWWSAL